MADPRYGAGGEGFGETLARMQQQSAASDELRRKEEQRAQVEERSTGSLRGNVGARQGAAAATDQLSSSLRSSIGLLNAETAAIEANTAALRRRAAVLSEGSVASAPRRTPAAARTAPQEAAFIGPLESPQRAQARYQDALRAQAAAEIQQRQARTAVTSASRAGASAEQLAPLVGQREAANQAVASARQQSRAAASNVAAQEQAASTQAAAVRAQAAENTRLVAAEAQHAKAEQEAAAAAREQAASVRRAASAQQRAVITGGRQLGVGEGPLALGPGSNVVSGGPASSIRGPGQRQFIAGPVGGLGAARGPNEGFSATEQLANRNAIALKGVAGAQGDVNRVVQQSVAQYGASSQALQRHGALTAEFIQGFARGEVTLQEFQSQMLTTMGKFGGWAVAGAAVYGVVDALRKLADGAKEAQSGYIQLTRFIPNVNQRQAEGTFTNISSQLNVPIKDVVDTMTIMARTFKTLPEAAEATRAALLASKLDQIPTSQSAPALVGISQAFGLNAKGTLGVIDSLNALQRDYGARVSQTLPGLARAAPAALAAGVDQHTLEALIGVGVRAGFSGPQVATAVARSATTFVQKPADQALLESYGFNPNQSYGGLIKQISSFIGERDKEGRPVSGKELRDLAIGLAGPQLGARTFAAILARGGDINKFAETAAHPGTTAEQERQKQLKSVSEQISSIGIGIENFGAGLASSGILIPLQALLSVLHQVSTAAGTLLSPLGAIGAALSSLPGPVRELLGALALGAGGQALYRTTFGRTATGALGRIPGFSFLDSPQRDAVRQLEQTQRVGLDFAKRQQEQSAFRTATTAQGYNRATQSVLGFQQPQSVVAGYSTEERAAYEQQLARLLQAQANAEKAAIAAQEAYLTDLDTTRDFQAQIAVYKSKELSDAQKVAFGAATGAAATPFGAPTTLPIQTGQRARLDELQRNALLTPEARSRQYIEQARRGGTTPGGVALPGGVSPSLGSVDPEIIAGQSLKMAEAEQPGFIAGKFQALSSRLRSGGTISGAVGGGAAQVAGSRVVGLADRGLGGLSTLGAGLVGGIPGALGAAFQGILAAQVVNAAVPGGAGDFLGKAITGGSLGLGASSLINNTLKQYGKDYRIGAPAAFGLGVGLQQLQQPGTANQALGAGLAVGSAVALIPGVGLPLALAAGATAAGGVALDKLLGVNQDPNKNLPAGAPRFDASKALGGAGFSDAGSQYIKRYQDRLRQFVAEQQQVGDVGQYNLSDDQIAAFGDTFRQKITDAFTKTGKDADTAVAGVNHDIAALSGKLQLFGGASQAGTQATSLLREAASQSITQAGRDPTHIDQYLQIAQKATDALDSDAKNSFDIANARARSGSDRAGALQQLIAAQQANVQAIYDDPAAQNEATLQALEKRYNELLAERGTTAFAQAGGSKSLNSLGTQITQAQGAINALKQGGAQQRGLNLITQQQAQQQVYSAAQGDIQANTTLAQARAGSGDTLASLRAQFKGQQQELANAAQNLSLNPEQQANEMATIQAKLVQTNEAVVKEVNARAQSLEKVQEALVPLDIPLGAADKVLADAQADLTRMERANAQAKHAGLGPVYSPEEINQQQIQVIQASRQRTQQALTNLQAQGELSQSQIPAYDPVAVAQGQLSNAEQTAAFMKTHASAFNYTDILRAMASVNSARQAVAEAMHQNAAQMSQAQGEIAKAQDVGNTVAQAQDDITTALRALQAARTPLERAQAQAQLLNAQNAQYQAVTQRADSGFQLKQVDATGDARRQAAIERSRALFDLSRARGPDEAASAQIELAQANVAIHQAQQQHIEALGSLQEAQSGGAPQRQAQIAIRTAQAELANARGIDERIAAETKLASAELQLSQAREALIAQRGQLRETRATGDTVRQAQIAVATANQELAAARTPEERRQAIQSQASAQVQLHQATQQRISALGSLSQAESQGDAVRSAQIAVQVAAAELANAHGIDEQIQAETALVNAEYQLHQAQQQRLRALGNLTRAQALGDPVAEAQAALVLAEAELQAAVGIDERIQAEADLITAQTALHQAMQNRIIALGQLAASTTREPLKQLGDEIAAVALALSQATTADERISLGTQLNQLKNQYASTLIQQTESTINFQLFMKEITAQQAIAQLRALEDTQSVTLQERQQIEQQIRQLQLGTGSSTFNLAPGQIKLPTIYDITRAIGGGLRGVSSSAPPISAKAETSITVYVGSNADISKVSDAIDRSTGSQLAGALRAAGIA